VRAGLLGPAVVPGATQQCFLIIDRVNNLFFLSVSCIDL